jgi:3-dehydroquinate synthase
MRKKQVTGPTGSYPVIVEEGLLSSAGRLALGVLGRTCTAAIVTNPAVGRHYRHVLERSLSASGFRPRAFEVPDGEEHKTLDTVTDLYARFLEAGLDRTCVILALGGGVIGDLAGFAAATYMRGTALIQVPTSLLAMVDSSIGGKTGVDLPQGKNLVGAFKNPKAVLVDPTVLSTLPSEEIANGMAEVIKHGLIGAPVLFEELCDSAPRDPAVVVYEAARVKVEIVERDPFEKGPRMQLNLGHTFGHAIEAASSYSVGHGRAVALGLVAATHLSAQLERCAPSLLDRVKQAVSIQNLPTSLPGHPLEKVLPFMEHDKKREEGTFRFVIPEEPGSVVIVENPPEQAVNNALASVLPG